MKTRRSLDFRSFDEVAADVTALASGPCRRCGQWDLATTCDRLAKTFESGLENKPVHFWLLVRMVAPIFGPMIFRRVLKTRRFPTGVKAPPSLVPEQWKDAMLIHCSHHLSFLQPGEAQAQ